MTSIYHRLSVMGLKQASQIQRVQATSTWSWHCMVDGKYQQKLL